MIQLRVINGRTAGDLLVVRRFPFNVGRAADNHLVLDEPGVWDYHLALDFQADEGFLLTTAPEAFLAINEQPQSAARLRNGDVISFGSSKLQFWLAPPQQRSLRFREAAVWLILAAATGFQVVLLLRLFK